MCCILDIFAVKNAVLCGSVSDTAESSGILDLPLNKDALCKDAFAMDNGLVQARIQMKGLFCQNSEWGLKLAVETGRHTTSKRVSIHTSRQFALNVTRIRRK